MGIPAIPWSKADQGVGTLPIIGPDAENGGVDGGPRDAIEETGATVTVPRLVTRMC